MSYRTRPVWEFPINWASQPGATFSYDLRKLNIGFGALRFSPLQSWVVAGAEFSVDLRGEQAVEDFEAFCNALAGRLFGFWIPAPWSAVIIVSGLSGTQFDASDSALAASWGLKPDQHLAFYKNGVAPQYAKITAVNVVSGNERITVDTAVSVDASWTCQKLWYARFANDTEEAECQGENWQKRLIRVVELPSEYVSYETGDKPVYFYRVWQGALTAAPSSVDDWFFTSFQSDLNSTYNGLMASQAHNSKPINHGAINNNLKADKAQVTLDVVLEAGTPWARLLPTISPRPMWIEIRKANWGALNTTTLLFTGQLLQSTVDGLRMQIKCSSFLDALSRRLLSKMYQRECNWHLYAAGSCDVVEADFTVAVTISAIVGRKVTITGAGLAGKAAAWFAHGKLTTGAGRNLQVVDIQNSAVAVGTSIDLILTSPLFTAVVGDAANVAAGCDLIFHTCKVKFNNAVNFGGHHSIPTTNLSIDYLRVDAANGNKK